METFQFHNDAPILNYCQMSRNSSGFSGLASAFVRIKQTKFANSISLLIQESLKTKVGKHIDFENAIKKIKIKGEPKFHCSMNKRDPMIF